MLTTLSTTGLGDYHPKADEERILTAILFLSGTSLFSFMLGSFIVRSSSSSIKTWNKLMNSYCFSTS